MKKAVVNELISTMREVTPKEGNLANILMDILCMSKEAIYRRLRGEVAFTFSEVAIIAGQLGYLNADFEKYEVIDGVRVRRGNETKDWCGPINAGVTLVWKLF